MHATLACALLGALAAASYSGAAAAADRPMNNRYPYLLGNAQTGFRPAPTHRGEFIDVYSRPIRTTYSEVFWAQQDPIPLPEDFVQRFAGKTAAFVGYEADIFRNDTATGKLKSVPCYEQYNHHYAVGLLGNRTRLAFVGRQPYLDERTVNAHRHAALWEAREIASEPGSAPAAGSANVPTFQMFVEGNGNEYRRTFKYMPVGYGQLLYSPTHFAPNFMFINTNNPDTPDWGARGGPLPQGGKMPGWISMGSRAPPNASYSGLLECPCTTRVEKKFTGHSTLTKGTCPAGRAISAAKECFEASSVVYGGSGFEVIKNATVSDPSEPAGCYVLATPRGFEVYFNTQTNSTQQCGVSAGRPARSTGMLVESESDVSVGLDLDAKTGVARITITGSAGSWLGVGFDAVKMADAPYAIIVEPGSDKGPGSRARTSVTERVLANHAAGRGPLSPSMITIVSDTVSRNGTTRTVVLTRNLTGATADHYTFDPSMSSINLIAATGQSASFSYHGPTRGAGEIMMVLMGAPVCLCESASPGGSINGLPWTSDCFNPQLLQQKNPSCDIRTYRGGMTCCHDGVKLLDADQELPERVDDFVARFRFYFESDPVESKLPAGKNVGRGTAGVVPSNTSAPTSNAFFMFREVEFNHGEYDIPQAPAGTPPEERVHTLISHFTVADTISDCKGDMSRWMCAPSKNGNFPQSQYIDLVHVSAHCHAPSCISMELINADTGNTICLVEPIYGEGGTNGNKDDIHDEEGYVVALPPCIWGSAEEGLEAPPRLSLDTNMTAIKKSNSTYFHYGVMSHFQMRGSWAPTSP